MIGYIRGTIEEIGEDSIIVECSRIGFLIHVPMNRAFTGLRIGEEVKIHTYMSVREDDISLYGFLTKDDLEAYKLLLLVSGVGPKAALGVLSQMDADTLRVAVLTEDTAAIAKAPGLGKKTAQKIILELKDKFHLEDIASIREVTGESAPENDEAAQDAVQALVALGYSGSEALKAVRKAAAEIRSDDPEALLKAALKQLF